MYLPSPQPVYNPDIFIGGDVLIDPTAVLGPGVILQAAPYSQIIIGSGACLGMGVIVNAHNGVVEIQSGAILGAGVLMIGEGKIGSNACIGAATTILNTSVEAMTIIPAGSLLGDSSRKVSEFSTQETVLLKPTSSSAGISESIFSEDSSLIEPDPFATTETEFEQIKLNSETPESQSQTQPKEEKSAIIGQVYINQLLVTLFPEKNTLNNLKKSE